MPNLKKVFINPSVEVWIPYKEVSAIICQAKLWITVHIHFNLYWHTFVRAVPSNWYAHTNGGGGFKAFQKKKKCFRYENLSADLSDMWNLPCLHFVCDFDVCLKYLMMSLRRFIFNLIDFGSIECIALAAMPMSFFLDNHAVLFVLHLEKNAPPNVISRYKYVRGKLRFI